MSILSTGTVRGDKVVFAQNFESRRMVLDNSGVLVGCNVGLRGPGIIPTAASSRVTYDKTQSTLINATQATWRLRFRTGAVVPTNKYMLQKGPIAFNDNQWFTIWDGGHLVLYVAASAADTANYASSDPIVVASTEYIYHFVFNGALAPGSRVKSYVAGLLVGTTVGGAIPAAMRASASPVTLFQNAGGTIHSPATDFTLFDARIWSVALSAIECQQDYAATTFGVGT